MPRDIPQGKKMPSLSIIDIHAHPKGDKGAAPDPDAGADKSEQSFSCPVCGAPLTCEAKGEESAEEPPAPAEAMGA